jgi:DNA-binding IclR family transcriptional regulator
VMVDEGFVTHLPEERRYGLGVAAFEIGTAYSRQEPLQRLARPLMARLVDDVQQTAHLAVLHGREVLYVVEERAPRRPSLVTDVGVRLPAQLAASGRAMLAALPAAQVRALFPDVTAFVLRHGVGPATPSQLRQVLTQVRRDGFAQEHGEITPGFSSVAAVVRGHTGHPAAAVAITFELDQAVDGDVENLTAAVLRTASALERRVNPRS